MSEQVSKQAVEIAKQINDAMAAGYCRDLLPDKKLAVFIEAALAASKERIEELELALNVLTRENDNRDQAEADYAKRMTDQLSASKEREAAAADTQRLDWLDEQREPISYDNNQTLHSYAWAIEAQHHSIRDAIDEEKRLSSTDATQSVESEKEEGKARNTDANSE